MRIQKPRAWDLSLGESVSVDGICSTVVARTASSFDVEYMPETLSKTTAAQFRAKRMINLERSLRYGDRIHGHFVTGHVDATSRVIKVEKQGRSRAVSIKVPREISKYIVPRGSIAVNGVSLTVARKSSGSFTVALIPHTLKVTNLANVVRADAVNIEVDILARLPALAGYRSGGRVAIHAKKKIRG